LNGRDRYHSTLDLSAPAITLAQLLDFECRQPEQLGKAVEHDRDELDPQGLLGSASVLRRHLIPGPIIAAIRSVLTSQSFQARSSITFLVATMADLAWFSDARTGGPNDRCCRDSDTQTTAPSDGAEHQRKGVVLDAPRPQRQADYRTGSG
jgi:hypothetical protein